MSQHVVIAGAGLAGACAALALAPTRRVIVLDSGAPGASHAAAGLVNPFMGRKAHPAWRASDALDALGAMLDDAGARGLWRQDGLLRPAGNEKQARAFRQRQAEHPNRLDWLAPEASGERFPDVLAPHGALWVREGGHIDIPAMIDAVLGAAVRAGAEVRRQRLMAWGAGSVQTDGGEIRAAHLLLCTGAATAPLAPGLPLHGVKGQTVRLRTPQAHGLPAVSGGTYVVPIAPREVLVGATFEHTWSVPGPTPEATALLVERASGVIPALARAEVVEARAGVRLTVPASTRPGRLPVLGPLAPEAESSSIPLHPSSRIPLSPWVFAGLGAKGLLTAPLLARHLPAWLAAPEAIWPEVSSLSLWREDG